MATDHTPTLSPCLPHVHTNSLKQCIRQPPLKMKTYPTDTNTHTMYCIYVNDTKIIHTVHIYIGPHGGATLLYIGPLSLQWIETNQVRATVRRYSLVHSTCGSRASGMGHRKQQMPNGHLRTKMQLLVGDEITYQFYGHLFSLDSSGCHKVAIIRRLHCTT